MNKRGFLLGEETLKIIIAVICILFLVFLLVAVYFSVTDATKSKEALSSIELIKNEVVFINSGGEYKTQGLLVPNPAGWFVFGFTGEKKPSSCTEQNCICICRNILVDWFDRQIKACDSKGACTPVPNLDSFDKIKIENAGTPVSIKKINNYIEISKK